MQLYNDGLANAVKGELHSGQFHDWAKIPCGGVHCRGAVIGILTVSLVRTQCGTERHEIGKLDLDAVWT